MSSIVSALGDLVKSMVEVVWSFFTTAGHLVQRTAEFFLQFVSAFVNLIVDFFKGLVDLTGGIVEFVVGNILILGVIAAAFFGFLQYQRKRGNEAKVGNRKLN